MDNFVSDSEILTNNFGNTIKRMLNMQTKN